MNLILERTDQVCFFTNMREVIAALGISCSDYDWYVSDIETNGFQFAEGWYPGSELELQITSDDIQFIWAVFSAFPEGVRVDVKEAPFVDGNPHYWDGSEPGPQLNGARSLRGRSFWPPFLSERGKVQPALLRAPSIGLRYRFSAGCAELVS